MVSNKTINNCQLAAGATVKIAVVAVAAVIKQLMAMVSNSQLKVAGQNGGGKAIKMVGYGGQASNSRTVKIVLGLEQVG